MAEEDLVPDWIDSPGSGWAFVVANVDQALRLFYLQCAQLAVVGVDNDGNLDLMHAGTQEDPDHPRHWNHNSASQKCRACRLEQAIARARTFLPPLPQKPPATWPVLLAVPVETVEAWLLELQAIIEPNRGVAQAERRGRGGFKLALYGQPAATRQAVEQIALPLVRSAGGSHLDELCQRSRSFGMFAAQLQQQRSIILGAPDCWLAGDGAAER